MLWLLTLACAPEIVENEACEVTFSPEVHTVLEASWTSTLPGRAWAEYEVDGKTQQTPAVDDGSSSHHAVLLGLAPLVDTAWTLVTESGGQRAECSGVTRTENVLPQTTGLRIQDYDPAIASDEPYLLGTTYHGPGGHSTVFVISKDDGAFRWYAHSDDGTEVSWASPVGTTPVLENGLRFNSFAADFTADEGRVVTLDATGRVASDLRTVRGHHGFTELPDGTLTYLSLEPGSWTDEDGVAHDVAGDGIWEVGTDGVPRQIFSIWDYLEPTPNPFWTETLYPGYLDWSHADSIRWDAGLASYIVSFAHIGQIWLIGRDGVPSRRVGLDTDTPPADGVDWHLPHDATILPDGTLLVFLVQDELAGSGCHQFRIDPSELAPVWGYDSPLVARFLGRCRRLANGNTLIGFGNAGAAREVTPDGDVAWAAQVTDPAGLSSLQPLETLYADPAE
jgi:hypothetical protein